MRSNDTQANAQHYADKYAALAVTHPEMIAAFAEYATRRDATDNDANLSAPVLPARLSARHPFAR